MDGTAQQVIVVGLDGSEPSQRALRWAMREARLRDGRVQVVAAWHWRLPGDDDDPWTFAPPSSYAELLEGEELERMAFERLDHAARDAVQRAADAEGVDVPVDVRVVQASAASALLEAARDADLLVVGSRGRGGFAGLLLGSVSQQCSQHAACPVVIVR